MKHKEQLGNGLLLLTAMIWGTAFVVQRVGMETAEPITFNAARMALATVAIGLVAFLARKKNPAASYSRRSTVLGGVCCGFFLAAGSILQQMGLVSTTAGKAGFLTALYILLVPVLGTVFFKKKHPWSVWLAVLLGVVGMYFLCISGEFRLARGDALVCLCAVFFSGHILCCDFFVRRGDPLTISAIQFATATVLSALVALCTESSSAAQIASAWLPILYCGLMSGGIGYTLQMVAQKYAAPTVAALLLSMESVFAVIAGALLLREYPSARELAGCAILFAAIVLVQLPFGKSKTQ